MVGRRGLVVALVAMAAWAPSAAAAGVEPIPGTVRLGPEAADPAGGARWTVRAWRARSEPRSAPARAPDAHCLQVGRRDGAMLVRTVRGAVRALGWRDRAVCDSASPLLVERLADAPGAAPARTIVAGRLGAGETGARLDVAGVRRRLPLVRRAFLAVLPGSVRRADLTLTFTGGKRARAVRFGRGERGAALVPGSVRRALTVPALDSGPDVAVTAYEVEDRFNGRITCIEIGRAIGAEAGRYDPGWDVFLDSPTLVELEPFEDAVPAVSAPGILDGCVNRSSPDFVIAPPLGPSSMALAFRPPEGQSLTVTTAAGAPVPFVPLPVPPGGVFAQLPATGAHGEYLRGEWVDAGGARRRGRLWLGSHDVPVRFTRYVLRGRRTLRVGWVARGDGAVGPASVVERARSVRLRVTRFVPSPFGSDGFVAGRPDDQQTYCAEVRLARPLGDRRVIEATSGDIARRARRRAPGYGDCEPITAAAEPQVATASGRSASATPARSG